MNMVVLIVDDNKDVYDSLALILGYYHYSCRWAESGKQAEAITRSEKIDAVLLDLSLKNESGLDVLVALTRVDPRLPVIMITAFGTFEAAVKAVKLGAVDFLPKPVKAEKLLAALDAALRNREWRDQPIQEEDNPCPLRSRDPGTLAVIAKASMLAATNIPVLITGESGTGKELLTEYLHRSSPRRDQPFVRVNCSGFSETLVDNELFGHEKGAYTGAVETHSGLFEQADNGTLHLDEIGDMSQPLQAKLLRVLENGELRRLGGVRDIRVDVRIIASTNKNLEDMADKGTFRKDLLFRLSAAHLSLSPLRERVCDLELLADMYLREFAGGGALKRFSDKAWERMIAHAWPGNVRELRGVIQTAVATTPGDVIGEESLPDGLGREKASMSGRLDVAEWDIIEQTLEEAGGNKSLAAEKLGISRRTLYNKMARYGL
ncbi:MAG: sigma-54 dependent transcriptional regulator [Planctomycetaceae bacterium]|nr:sigma-54 dependent transcriptional regulator [Planctomycetaceae bacterium]